MGFGEIFKTDDWWKAVLWVGVAFIGVGLLFQIEIVSRKHLIGIGIGMFIVGLANLIALKTQIIPYGNQGFFQGRSPIHNTFTKIMQIIGYVIAVFFLGLLLWGLI